MTNTSLTYTVISDNKLCCAKKKVVLVPLPVYLVKTSSSILKTFSTVHSPAEALRILSLGKVISTSEPYSNLNNNLKDFSLPLDR